MNGMPLDAGPARTLARKILQDGRVAFSKHAREEMGKDDISEVDVVNAIRGGIVCFPEMERGAWRYRVRTRKFTVVIAFRSQDELVVVTAWRMDE